MSVEYQQILINQVDTAYEYDMKTSNYGLYTVVQVVV